MQLVVCGLLFVLGVLWSAASPLSPTPALAYASLRIGESAPAVSLTDLSGRKLRLPEDLRGKVVLLHFWAAGCSSCKEEMPAMEALQSRFARKGLAILAVNVGQRKDAVQRYLAGMKVSYPVYLDRDTGIAQRYEVVGVPKTFILDRNGLIRYKIVGGASAQSLTRLVSSLL